jgi:hypothetical protein
MLKVSSIDPTDISDESGRKIHISTGPRLYFRDKFYSDFGDIRNEELNKIIAEDVSRSTTVKAFVPSTGSIAEKKRELGSIKKSQSFGIFYFCVSADSITRVISVKESIKEGKPPQEYGSRVATGIMDPKHGREIRVNTTVRNIFRQDYKTMSFPLDPLKTFQNAGILELSKYIADLYAKNSNKVRKIWKTPSRSENLMEIRTFGSNQFFVTILDESYCDIVSVQDQFLSEKTKKYREEKVTKEYAPSRAGKGERKHKKDYLR